MIVTGAPAGPSGDAARFGTIKSPPHTASGTVRLLSPSSQVAQTPEKIIEQIIKGSTQWVSRLFRS
jgi:hypothetical protein